MAILTFDTYSFVSNLKKAGLKEEQALAIADEMQKIDLEHVATKQDISDLESRMMKFIVPTLLGQAAVFAIIVKLLN